MKHRDVRRLMQGPTASIQPRASILAPESTCLTTILICLLGVNEWTRERMTAALGPFVNEATPYNDYGLRALRWMFLEVSYYHITRKCLQGLRVAYRKPNSHSSPCHQPTESGADVLFQTHFQPFQPQLQPSTRCSFLPPHLCLCWSLSPGHPWTVSPPT